MIVSSRTPMSWDGNHELVARFDTPDKVNIRQLGLMRGSQLDELKKRLIGDLLRKVNPPPPPSQGTP